MTRADLLRVVEAAVLAPSIHNTQPWLFRISGDTVEVYADLTRQARITDPDAKAVRVSCGAAVFNARMAFAHLGYAVETVVLPEGRLPHLLARITATEAKRADPVQEQLFEAVARRHSNREPFLSTDVPPEVRARLIEAARTEGAWLDCMTGYDTQYLISELIRTADDILARDVDYQNELRFWIRDGASRDGVPRELGGPAPKPADLLARRDFGGQTGQHERTYEAHPLLAVLGAYGDRPSDDVVAGQALQRVLLTATSSGLATSLLSQPVDVPHIREQLRLALRRPGLPQMVLRIGYGMAGYSPPRRPLDAVLLPEPTNEVG